MQIIFSYHKGNIISKMIMWMTDSNMSHTSIRFGREEKNWMIEAAGGGVQPGWWNKFIAKNKIVHAYEFVEIDEVELEKIVDECLDKMVGKKYDIFGILGFAVAIGLKKLGFKNIKNIFGSRKLYFCSELVMRIGFSIQNKFAIEIFKGDPELTSPYDLFLQCVNNKYLTDRSLDYEKNS
jgi:hypothetical protein